MTNTLRLGILGCGSFVQKRILPAIQNIPAIQVTCIQRRNQEEAKKIATQFADVLGGAAIVSTRWELLENPAVDAVLIATPPGLHEEDALACARARKPVFCEKPLSHQLSSATRIAQAFQEQGLPLLVGHCLRFKPALQIARKMVAEGKLGDLKRLRFFYDSASQIGGSWRASREFGGGALQDLGIHLIDLIHFVSGEKITKAYGVSYPPFDEKSSIPDERISVLCELPRGIAAEFDCSYNQSYYNGFEIIGSRSRLVGRDNLRQPDKQTENQIESLTQIFPDGTETPLSLPFTNIYVAELQHFVDVVRGVQTGPIPTEIIPSEIAPEISVEAQRVISYLNLNS